MVGLEPYIAYSCKSECVVSEERELTPLALSCLILDVVLK